MLDKNNSFSGLSQVISGLDWVLNNHPEIRVINASLGMLLFASSGNNASPTSMGSPSCNQSTISVRAVYDGNNGSITFPGGCTDATTTADQITCFTQSNVTLDLLAPGALITST